VKRFTLTVGILGVMTLAGCNQQAQQAPPAPHELTGAAIGHYCGMNLIEHNGPKGQIILASRDEPVWFSSARDAFSFTMLPEEPKDIRAIYVSDMAKAPSWEDPGATNWVDAHKAYFVIGSGMQGGMGAPETVPFSERAAAQKFAADHGGRIVTFDEVPRDYILGSQPAANSPTAEPDAQQPTGQSRFP
jgi:copper chaperone NosL